MRLIAALIGIVVFGYISLIGIGGIISFFQFIMAIFA